MCVPNQRPRWWAMAAALAGVALAGFVAGYAPASVRADSDGPQAADTSALHASGETVSGAPARPDHHGRIIIVRPYPCYPCPGGYPWPNPCYDPNYPPFPQPPAPPVPGATAAATMPPPPPGATAVPPTPYPVPSPTPGGMAQTLTYRVCPQVTRLIPQYIQDLAVSEPWRYYGYGQLLNPNVHYHPMWNGYRTRLSLRDNSQPYSPCNLPLWKSGCP